MMFRSILVIVVLCVVGERVSARIPQYLKVCRRNDPKIGECFKNAVEHLRPYLLKGLPELDLPSYEPLVLPEVILQSGTRSVNFRAVFRNVTVYGSSKFVLKNVTFDTDIYKLSVSILLPQLRIMADYNIDGRVLLLPLRGSGVADGNYTNVVARADIKAETQLKGNAEHLTVTSVELDINIEHAVLYFENLFNGDKTLGDATNKFFNLHIQEILHEVKPILEETIGTIFRQITNRIFHKFSIDELLPQE